MASLIFLITMFYLVSVEPKGAVITVDTSSKNNEKNTLGNIRNDPRDVVENGVESNNENQVLEDPEGAHMNNKLDSEQVVEPPKNVITFPGILFLQT